MVLINSCLFNTYTVSEETHTLTEMELKVLIAAISELKATRTTRTTKVKTAGEAAREGEVESLEGVGSGLIGLLASVLATVVLGATLYTSRPPHSPTLIRQDLVRLRDFLELLLSLLLVLLLFPHTPLPLPHACRDATSAPACDTPS